MAEQRWRRFVKADLAWAALSGLLLALAFPQPGFAPLAWIGLVPLLLNCQRRPFLSGFVAGCGFFGAILYWVNLVMVNYGGLDPVLAFAAYLMLVGYLALYFGAATWSAVRLLQYRRIPFTLSLPFLWTAFEFVRAHALSGFPWANLGYSQVGVLSVMQIADLFGVYGIGFLVVLVNTVIAETIRTVRVRQFAQLPFKGLALASLLVIGTFSYGERQLALPSDPAAETWPVALIQGNIDQGVKWDPAYRRSILERYQRLSLEAATQQPDLIVWPEAATPFYFQDPGQPRDLVTELPRRTGAHLLFGSPAYELENGRPVSFNSSYLLAPDGRTVGRSDKVHLVPFGEYVPLQRFLPFIKKMVVGIGDFRPGVVQPLPLDGHDLGVLVCYEVIFPELARDYVNRGADLLVNITNDAWFGRSSAPWQHLAMARLRAVENRVWIARAANTGVTALISPRGEIVAQGGLFTEAIVRGSVGLGAGATLYRDIGDLLPWSCLLVSVIALVWLRRGGETMRKVEDQG